MKLPDHLRDLLNRYGAALVLASLALLIRWLMAVKEGTSIYQLPLAAVVLSAWYGGRGPGLLACLVSGAGALYLFIPPLYSFVLSPEYAVAYFIFVGLCLLLSEFSAGRRRSELALRTSEERFRTLVQFSFDVYWETDARHRVTRLRFSERLTNAPKPEDEIGKTPWEIPYIEPDEETWLRHRAMLDAHLPFRDIEITRPAPGGGTRHLSDSGMPVFDAVGRFVGYRGVGRDITDRKRAEVELRARQEMLDLAQSAAHAIAFDWYIDARESQNRWSPELEALYGLEPGTFDGTFEGWKKLIHPEDWPEVKVAIKHAQESGDVAAEYRVIHKDGKVHWLRAKGRMFFNRDGLPERMVGFMLDVSDWRQAEEALREKDHALQTARTELARVSRLTTLGEMTTSIAHEVSQPLGAMVASAGACTRWLAADPPALPEARAALDNIVSDGKRAREVIARIRALTRRQVPRKNQLDINHEIVEVLDLMKHEFRSHDIILLTELNPTPPSVGGERVQLQQVLINLIVNAIEAMSSVHDRPRELTVVSRQDGADAVLVEVRDSGTGLDPQLVEQVFEAFYTTKSDGIGIGLAISRSIVEAHGGRLWAAPNEPHGAVFRISLPIAREAAS